MQNNHTAKVWLASLVFTAAIAQIQLTRRLPRPASIRA
jgi:hypothetical protein